MKTLAFIKRSNGSHWVGDGFPVRSIFSYSDIAQEISPFLLMDYAGPTRFEPTSARRGVGEHPHRGFETVSIVYEGEVSHRDSSGAGGTIGPGDVQWMTAAAGIVHEEFHSAHYAAQGGPFEMVQLWVNLPAKDKMTAPGYQGITAAQIPSLALTGDAGTVRVIAGAFQDAPGPAHTFTPMNVWDLRVRAEKSVSLQVPEGHTSALFVMKGALRLPSGQQVQSAELAVFARAGTQLEFEALQDSTLLLLSGEPIDEPIVGYGPFVMNTETEIRQALQDYRSGLMGHLTE